MSTYRPFTKSSSSCPIQGACQVQESTLSLGLSFVHQLHFDVGHVHHRSVLPQGSGHEGHARIGEWIGVQHVCLRVDGAQSHHELHHSTGRSQIGSDSGCPYLWCVQHSLWTLGSSRRSDHIHLALLCGENMRSGWWHSFRDIHLHHFDARVSG